MEKGLISAVTPCYNTGHLIHRLLDSILVQDYPKLELLIIDDGSVDNTKDVVDSYVKLFITKGYSLRYIKQANSGQSVAMSVALRECRGEFLVWPDSDDYLCDKSLYSKMVDALIKADEQTTMVRCLPQFINEGDLSIISKKNWNSSTTDIFEECLFGKSSFWFPPVCYMAKMSAIDQLIPGRKIYTEKLAGQNWQIMLPLFYKHHCITLPIYSACVLERNASHSRGQFQTYEQQSNKYLSYQRTIVETLKQMNDNMDYYINQINKKYYELQVILAFEAGETNAVRKYYNLLNCLKGVDISRKCLIKYILSFVPGYKRIFQIYKDNR